MLYDSGLPLKDGSSMLGSVALCCTLGTRGTPATLLVAGTDEAGANVLILYQVGTPPYQSYPNILCPTPIEQYKYSQTIRHWQFSEN